MAAPVASLSSLPVRPTLALGIPTRGRPAILKETLRDLQLQRWQPDAIFVAYYDPADLGEARGEFPQVTFIQGTGGSCEQRNRLLDAVGDRFDLVFIMDDDCYLHHEYLERTVEVFAGDKTVVATTGCIVENGAKGPGLTGEYARNLLRAQGPAPTHAERPPVPHFNTDGCNMAFRVAPIASHHVRFDENMPGYAWYEDIDFSGRLKPYGRILRVPAAQAVHLGAKVGKTSGKRFGYSQIANPIYLLHKGLFRWYMVIDTIFRNLAANTLRSLFPEPWIDRRGRLAGNLLAFRDLFLGRLRPDGILKIQ